MRRIHTACACLLVLASAQALAQSAGGVYKWKDAQGNTHYTDTPPANVRYGNVEPNAQARVQAPAKPDPRCTTARSNLQRLNSGNADIGLDANGDGKPDTVLTAEQRTEQVAKAEAAERSFCSPAKP